MAACGIAATNWAPGVLESEMAFSQWDGLDAVRIQAMRGIGSRTNIRRYYVLCYWRDWLRVEYGGR